MLEQVRISWVGWVLSIFLFVFITAAPGWAELTCGDTIGPNQVAILTHTLECPGSGGPALTLMGNSILDLGKQTIDCVDMSRDGIEILEGGSILKGGTIHNCVIGVRVRGTGDHAITKVTVLKSDDEGFRVDVGSDGNLFEYNTAKLADNPGFSVFSSKNRLYHNKSLNASDTGFDVRGGNNNSLKGNVARGNIRGFEIEGDDMTVINNWAIENTPREGFFLKGDRAFVKGNLAKNNGDAPGINGFRITGHDVKTLFNKSLNHPGSGFNFSSGSRFLIVGNTAKNNTQRGIIMTLTTRDSTIFGNVAKGNDLIDLQDANLDCADNRWSGNFGTRTQECIQ